MRKLRRYRFQEFLIAAAATVLIVGAPAGAQAAAEESGGSTPEEAVTESPNSPTEQAGPEATAPAAPAPASTGWIPQGTATDASGSGAAPTSRGSSLGSGGGTKQDGSTGEAPSRSAAPTGSSHYYEPESSTPSTFEEPASAPQARSGTTPVERPAAEADTRKAVHAAIGAATPLARSESSQGASISYSLPVAAAPVANPRDQGAPGFGTLRLLVVIAGGFVLVYAGGRLVLGPVEPDIPGLVRFGARRFR